MARKKTTFRDDALDTAIAGMVIDSEYAIAGRNNQVENDEFQSLVDMLDLLRTEKDYDWMSDYYIPELNSILLSEGADWANQYFQTRDFVDCKLDLDMPGAAAKAAAARKCINNTLNDRRIFFYPKYMRLRTINAISTRGCYILARWERGVRTVKRTVQERVKLPVDIHGQPFTDPATQVQAFELQEKEMDVPVLTRDHFDFDVLDPRNVFMDNKYCYSLQQKDWITVRYEMTNDRLMELQDDPDYMNIDRALDAVKSVVQETETARQTYGKDTGKQKIDRTPLKTFDILDRYGKFWAIIKERDPQEGHPVTVEPGIDVEGRKLPGAEPVECIITYALIGPHKVLIRFIPTRNIDSSGNPFKPLARGLCYVHPTRDEGMSDGRNMRELQIAVNDTYNLSSDRVKLATLPMFIGNKNALDDNATVYIEPEHMIEVEDPSRDIRELIVRDNVNGAMQQLGLLTSKMQQVTARFPSTMGAPAKSGETATAVAGADQRASSRANYKSLTFEYTFLQELYWLILQMTHRFAHESTALRLMGQAAYDFDPTQDYTYTPVSSNIEQEYSKQRKVALYDQMIGRLSGLAKGIPEVLPVIAHITSRQAELLGDEYQDIARMIDQLSNAKWQGEGVPPTQQGNLPGPMTQNQNGLPVSGMEAATREGSFSGGGHLQ